MPHEILTVPYDGTPCFTAMYLHRDKLKRDPTDVELFDMGNANRYEVLCAHTDPAHSVMLAMSRTQLTRSSLVMQSAATASTRGTGSLAARW